MNRPYLGPLLAIVAAAALFGGFYPTVAHAQTSPPVSEGRKAPAHSRRFLGGFILPDFGRFGAEIGGFGAHGGGAAVRDEKAWEMIGFTYRLQAAGKRTFLQPDLYTDIAQTSGVSTNQSSYYDAGRGRGFWGIGASTRSVAYFLRGKASAFVGAGGGVYRLETFRHFERYSGPDVVSSYDQTTYTTFRPGGKLFAGLSHQSGLYAAASLHDAGTLHGLPYRGVAFVIGYRH